MGDSCRDADASPHGEESSPASLTSETPQPVNFGTLAWSISVAIHEGGF